MRQGREAADGTATGLVSGEAVHLEVRLARAGSRTLALMLDVLAQVMVAMLLLPLLTFGLMLVLGPDTANVTSAYILTIVLVAVGYPTLLLALTRGRTLGKLAMGLRVVRDDGGPITLRQSFTRALVGATLEWPGLLLAVGWVASLAVLTGSPRGKRLADMAAGTLVVHDRTPESWGWVPSIPPPLAQWATTLDLTGLDDELALAARHFLARSRGLRDPHRTRLGHALATEIAACTTPAPPQDTPGWAYLAAVVGERHRRAAARLTRDRASHALLWPELFTPAQTVPQSRQPAARPGIPAQSGSPPTAASSAPSTPTGAAPLRSAAPR
ncbi:membrane protein [Catellatospora sp. IY07-71]|uniref:RDD family protein n=1 Tax=Catellatospora sp. IY07-71 TaxID=2728827 RepID=UPI001BB3AD1E|nr:RDD family protein [Catellatospora sp. IY07-71]BCJ70892.1 membrane protein [Catellatospora sp. IY07-71]